MAWLWLRTYWYVPLLVLAGGTFFLVWLLLPRAMQRRTNPAELLQVEFRALAAEHMAREIEAKSGLQAAQQAVSEKYLDKIESLNNQEMARVEKLKGDPAAMAKAIERLTKT
jgi:hypothetical protein